MNNMPFNVTFDLIRDKIHNTILSTRYTNLERFIETINNCSENSLLYSQFFSESELRFFRNYYVIIPFQIEWPDCTSQ